ncbi:MAG: ankyrin repeat domain-containing protein [Acidobacteriota bacterium]
MNQEKLKDLWEETLASPDIERFGSVAQAVVEAYKNNAGFRVHIKNRSDRVTARTGVAFDADNFDIGSARAYIADEIGFTGWTDLIGAIKDAGGIPILFSYAVAAMDRGDFTSLEEAVGPERFYEQILEWFERGLFESEKETLNEIFAAACMLGQTSTAEYLLEKGVDPYAGMKTGLAGFHYAASSGRLDVIRMLIERGITPEVKNMYGGTVFEQAIWSAVNEYTPDHAEIVEKLIEARAIFDVGYREWWDEQDVPDIETKDRIASVLERHERTLLKSALQKNKSDGKTHIHQ